MATFLICDATCSIVVEFDEGIGKEAGRLPLPLEEDPLVGDKDIVEDRQGIYHPVPGADRVVEGVGLG